MNLTAPINCHAGDCKIYRALANGSPCDGICVCGYGWSKVRQGDWSQMYSAERQQDNNRIERLRFNLAEAQKIITDRPGKAVWTVTDTDGTRSFKCASEDDAKWLIDQLWLADQLDRRLAAHPETADSSTHARSMSGPKGQG